MKDTIYRILKELRPDVDFEKASSLIDDGILDSFDVINLVGELNEAFSIDISVEDILPSNFNSVDRIVKLIERVRTK